MVKGRASWLAVGAAIACGSVACAQLLGIEAIHDDPPDAGEEDGAVVDGASAVDAGLDAHAPVDASSDHAVDLDADAANPVRAALGCASPDGAPIRFFPKATPFGIVLGLDDTDLYVADQTNVRRCSLEGCDAGIALVVSEAPRAFAKGPLHVIYADSAHLNLTDKNGFVAAQYLSAGITLIATNGADVFWTETTVLRHAVDSVDASAETPSALLLDGGTPAALAASDAYTFFVDYAGDASTGRLVRCRTPTCAGNPEVIAAINGRGAAIAVDSTTVYWSDPGAQEIRACAVGGCDAGVRTIATGVVAGSLAVDSKALYWTTFAQLGSVVKALHDGGAASVVADGFRYPANVLANDACIYWSVQGFVPAQSPGSVWARPQP